MPTPATAPSASPADADATLPFAEPVHSATPLGLPAPRADADPTGGAVRWRLRLALTLTVALVGLEAADAIWAEQPVLTALGRRGLLAVQAALCTPVVFVCGWPILVRAWRTVRTRRLDVYTLVGLGITAAFTFSVVALLYEALGLTAIAKPDATVTELKPEVAGGIAAVAPYAGGAIAPFFEGAAVMVVLMLFGLALEHRARSRTGEAIHKLVRLAPTTARVVLPDGAEDVRALDQVQPGDRVRVGPGERIPVDGIVLDGTTTVDESLLTGEPMRTGKRPGSTVLAGTENALGTIEIEVQRVNTDTALAHVAALVARAQQARVPLQRTADRIAAWLVVFAILAAAGTYATWAAIAPAGWQTTAAVCAVGVLVAACPVALALAAPTAVVVGMRRAARGGILFRDGAALEHLARVDSVLFDKTGTLTEGKMKLIAVEANPFVQENEVLALAAAVERGSVHPIGLGIVWDAARRKLSIPIAEDVEELPGKGVRGRIDGRLVCVGRMGFLQECGVYKDPMYGQAQTERMRGNSVVFVGRDSECIGTIVMHDTLRPSAGATVKELLAAGVRPTLVTGDDADTAAAVARDVGIEEVVADTLPAEKYAVVKSKKNAGRVVAMCGDGVNDAPALAAADVGIALGTGTEVAVSTAGVALGQPDLRKVLEARTRSRSTVQTIRQNLLVSLGYTAIAAPIAGGALVPLGGGLVTPAWQAAAVAVTSLLVIVNSQRAGRG
ncbi:MAG TPA: heavy metal translocating P-type ATPase [Gemmataceae bacterium]|nr:heavy metal translocating P-type ATPase [Gemmataceae bacterium]